MNEPPAELDGAKVLKYVYLHGGIRKTGNVLHRVDGQELAGVSRLAICQYDGEEDHCIFFCDSCWNVLTDLCRETMDAALGQAEFEYEGVSEHWEDYAQQ